MFVTAFWLAAGRYGRSVRWTATREATMTLAVRLGLKSHVTHNDVGVVASCAARSARAIARALEVRCSI